MRILSRKLATALALMACLGVAQAGPMLIDFDHGVDTSYAGMAPFLTHGDAIIQSDYFVATSSTKAGAQFGDLVGLLVNGSDVANTCFGLVCPTNNSTGFLGMVNDGLPWIARLDGGTFHLLSFDAGFIAASGDQPPGVALLLRVWGFTANGGAFYEDALLPGPDANGALNFGNFKLSDTFAALDLLEVDFYGYACNDAGSCNRSSNKAQFGLDNVLLSTVPEPSSLVLLGVAIAGLGVVRRRTANT